MPYERREHPAFSWSHSRRGTFEECPRKYYYHYYGSHNGWEDDAPQDARRAYRLKKLTSLPLELGYVVHRAASVALAVYSRGATLTVDNLYLTVRDRLNRVWQESQDRAGWERLPSHRKMFREFYYGDGIDRAELSDARGQLMQCLTNLLESVSFREAMESRVVAIEKFSTALRVDEVDVHAVPDLVYQRDDGLWTIVDWKSGNAPDESRGREQALVYALYVRGNHATGESKIRGRIEQLAHGYADHYEFTDDDLQGCVETIRHSIKAMKGCLSDVGLNELLAKEAFPMRWGTWPCRLCNFYELCQEEMAPAEARSSA